MPKLGVFSGAELCRLLEKEGFANIRQRGSHVVMQRHAEGQTITVPIPMHKEIRMGTLMAIVRQSRLARSLFER